MKRLSLALLVLTGCGPDANVKPAARVTMPTATASSATTPAGSASAAPAAVSGPIAWVHDDYDGALALAKKRGVPLFVDAWAPWCHTCLSMKKFVLDDASMPKERFVWLSIDVDKEQNAKAAQKLAAHVLPTFFVVDAEADEVRGAWAGAASIGQLRGFLSDGERAVRAANAPLPETDPLHWVVAGDRATAASDPVAAAAAYEKALALAPRDWDRRPETLAMRVEALASAKDPGKCVDAAIAALPLAGRTSSATDLGSAALDCAGELPKSDARAPTLRKLVAEATLAIATDGSTPLSADDRGDALHVAWEANDALGDHPAALQNAVMRDKILAEAAAKAPDPATAATYDGTRMETLLYLGRAAEAKALLEAREKEMPEDYNPPHRLAKVLLTMGDPKGAVAAARRALKLGYGPRKGLVYAVLVDSLVASGDKPGAIAALEEEVAFLKALPEGQKRPAALAGAEKKLDAMKKK